MFCTGFSSSSSSLHHSRTSLSTTLLRLHVASDVQFGVRVLRGSSTVPRMKVKQIQPTPVLRSETPEHKF